MSGNGELPIDPEAIGDEIARTAAHLDGATHRLLACIRAFDASEEWLRQGALSCAHWLTWRLRLDPVTAREKVRVARALGTLPHLDDALRRGVLSYSQVRPSPGWRRPRMTSVSSWRPSSRQARSLTASA